MKKTYLNLSFKNTEFHSIALKFRNLSTKIDGLLSTGKFWEFSKSQQQHLLSKLRRLFEKLSGLDLKYAMKIAGAALCFTMISGSAKAIPSFQDFNPNNPFDCSEIFGVEGLSIYDGAFGDISGDGVFDDAILLTGCGAAYFEYDPGDQSFKEKTGDVNPFYGLYGSTSYYISAYGLDMADFDGDGVLDAVTIGSGWLYHYKLIDGKFEYVSGSDINTNHQSGNPYGTQVKFGDVDGDGDLDMVATYACGCSTFIYSLLQQSDHSFISNYGFPVCGPISSSDTYSTHINLADMDGDGDDDLFVFTVPNLGSPAPLAIPSSGSTNPKYYQNNAPASGPFTLVTSGVPLPLADMSSEDFPLLADLDGDGDIDVFTPGDSGGYNFKNLSAAPVPIPPLVALLAFAATGFGILRRNRKKKRE
jgi:hypothetical protein